MSMVSSAGGTGDYGVMITPDGGEPAQWAWNTSGHTFEFTVLNTGNCPDSYGIAVSKTGTVTAASVDPTSLYLDPGAWATVTVTYSVGSATSGRITVTAYGSAAVSDDGFLDVVAVNPLSVTPDGGTAPTRIANTGGYGEVFTVANSGTTQLTLTFTCAGTNSVTCSGTNPTSVVLAANGGWTTATALYSVGAPGSGTVKLTAKTADRGTSDSGTYYVPIVDRAAAVRAELPERQQFWATRTSQRFFVKNLRPQTATYNLSTVCTGAASTCSVTPSSLTLAFGESGVATVSDTAPSPGTGTVMLKAIDASLSSLRDSGSLALTADSAPAPVVSLFGMNPGTTVERDLCLTIAAGSNAAFECGDLRIVHALPAIRTLNKARVPTLLYNSIYAQPFPVVTAQVTVATVPDSVEAILRVGGVEKARGRWAGTDWTAGGTRQVALAYAPPDTAATKVYDYTLDVATIYLPSGYYLTSVPGRFILVNRAKSPFGAGWWLAGLERLDSLPDGSRLWVGGDGSARLYTLAANNVWVASTLDRRDTLTRAGSRYARRLPGGVTVGFNTSGLHDSTVNRLGHRTGFGYDTVAGVVRLRTISLPSGGGVQTYSFTYDGNNKLASVTDPGSRMTTVWANAERVDSIRDPDNRATKFSYESPSSKRINARTDRRGTVTSYSYDAAAKLWRVHVNLQPDSIRLGFRAREAVGLATATPKTATDTANAYTSFFGARNFATGGAYIPQEMKFWLDRYGAPRRIVNPLGYQTLIRREDGQWPALVTEVVAADGFTTHAGYDGRGNIVRSTAVQPLGPGQDAITRYHWDQRWDFADSVITPTGIVTTFAYDTANGNRLWQQLGSDPDRRITFRYSNSLKLLSATVLPQTPPDSIDYDTVLGNVAAIRTPLNFWTSFYSDGLGRDTLVVTPIDSTDHARGGAADSTTRMRQRVVRTVMDRDSIAETIAPNRVQTAHMDKLYDAEGNLTSLARVSIPNSTGIGTITTQWRYDRANRRVAEIAPDGRVDSTLFDPSGNPVVALTRRKDPTSGARLSIGMTYDALNQLATRTLPPVTYVNHYSLLDTWPNHSTLYPDYPVPPDTQRFTYDSTGRLLTADNLDAKVKRSYYANGLLKTDSSWIQTLGHSDWTLHRYGVRHTYDLDGRRVSLAPPQQLLATGLVADSFVYDPQVGLLTSVRDFQWNWYQLAYTLRGDLDSLVYPAAYVERFKYDTLGRLATDTIWNRGGTNPPRLGASVLRATGYRYDARDNLLKSTDPLGFQDTLVASYSGLGHLATSRLSQHGQQLVGPQWYPAAFTSNETFSFDALGNRSRAVTLDTTTNASGGRIPDSTLHASAYQTATGRLRTDTLNAVITIYDYDSAGNIVFTTNAGSRGHPGEERASFYAADGSLRAVDWRWIADPTMDPTFRPEKYAFDEYRYDALGRRVWVRSQKTCFNVAGYWVETGECRSSLLRRTVWDGDQELAEIQMPGGVGQDSVFERDVGIVHLDNDGDNIDHNAYYGRVLYTPGRAIDQPLAVTRINYAYAHEDEGCCIPFRVMPPLTIVPFWNRNGDAPIGVFANNGGRLECDPPAGTGACVGVLWSYFFSGFNRNRNLMRDNWQGTILESKRDKTGLSYNRNRYYDPATGRFTQEDPIGLAGGLNLYGFANGDPVNFSDPLGLCVPPFTPLCLVAIAVASGATFFGGSRIAYNAATKRPLDEGVQGDVARGSLVGFGTGTLAAVSGLGTAMATDATATPVAASPAAAKLAVQFGRVANQIEHTFRHIDELGLNRDAVKAAVQQNLQTVASQLRPGTPLNQVIEVQGVRLQYTAYQLANGVVNVGRIHAAP